MARQQKWVVGDLRCFKPLSRVRHVEEIPNLIYLKQLDSCSSVFRLCTIYKGPTLPPMGVLGLGPEILSRSTMWIHRGSGAENSLDTPFERSMPTQLPAVDNVASRNRSKEAASSTVTSDLQKWILSFGQRDALAAHCNPSRAEARPDQKCRNTCFLLQDFLF